ncbi:hypothetical protein EVAR_82187_1 [Eumeta japonica]|uniref:Uncharacterized protein n=1 Tax=Eumeta variegata TaxID=151549 RepID=A0A4C2AF67_EUMVA|nr:hypothetical protein EVAR_82187_1 [Eumeta japonica]
MRGPTTARRSTVWGRGPRRSRTRSRARARVRQIAEIHGSLELPVDKVSPKSFPRLTSYNQATSLTLMSREQPREDERGMQGHCTVSPACLQSDAALDSVEHLRTPSFLVAGAQAHEAYRTIGSITVMYMVLTISGLRPHVALAARAKPL